MILVRKIIRVLDSIPWVRCASGNVFLTPSLQYMVDGFGAIIYDEIWKAKHFLSYIIINMVIWIYYHKYGYMNTLSYIWLYEYIIINMVIWIYYHIYGYMNTLSYIWLYDEGLQSTPLQTRPQSPDQSWRKDWQLCQIYQI